MPRWFLLLNGVALLVMGLTLITMRLREWTRARAPLPPLPPEPDEGAAAEGERYRGRVGLRLGSPSEAKAGAFGLFWGIVWALLCCSAGVALLLMAQGFLTQPGAQKVAAPRSRSLEFPSGR